jgi:tetratricopeptide (TPR) repeat protein
VELNPNLLDARNWLALSLQDTGRIGDALKELEVLLAIDPLFPPAVNNAMSYRDALGDYTGAVELAEKFVEMTNDPVVALDYRARIASTEGRIAEAIKLLEQIPEVSRDRGVIASLVGDYRRLGERPADRGIDQRSPTQRMITEARLGGHKLALELAATALSEAPEQVSVQVAYIDVLSITREHQRLMEFFETQYEGDVDIVATRLRSQSLIVPPPFRQLAVAARAMGNEAVFQAAMLRYRERIDTYRREGSVAWWFDLFDAYYWAMMGETELSLDYLESAVAKRVVMDFYFFLSAEFEPLGENPRFIAIRDANALRINEQREQLGLAPLPPQVFVEGFGGASE